MCPLPCSRLNTTSHWLPATSCRGNFFLGRPDMLTQVFLAVAKGFFVALHAARCALSIFRFK